MPDRCLARVWPVNQVIRMSITIEIGCSHKLPVHRKRWPNCSSDERGSGEISDHGLAGDRIEQSNVHVTVTVKIGDGGQIPSCWKRGQQRSSNNNVVVEEDNCSLTGAALENHEVRIVVAVKICCRD